jgi:lysophospholipid hydrolase
VIDQLARTATLHYMSLSTMAAPEAATSLVQSSAAALSSAPGAVQTSIAAIKAAENAPSSTFGLLARTILSILSVLPTVLFWVSYTLPTWLFTLFSMSLTFTMNFTTL